MEYIINEAPLVNTAHITPQQAKNVIRYSRGENTYDNAPAQCTATDFDDFESKLLADRSPRKGLTFVCAPLAQGVHDHNPAKYPGVKAWRLATLVERRYFLPFDFDGFDTAERFQELLEYLKRYRGFGYPHARRSRYDGGTEAVVGCL